MPTYILLSTLTPEGRQTLHRNPERLEEVNREITEFGCKVVAQYAVLGPYDFVSIIEADDNETIAHLSVDLGSRGDRAHYDPAGHVGGPVAGETERAAPDGALLSRATRVCGFGG